MDWTFLEEFGKAFVPKKLRPGLGSYLAKAGVEEVPYKFFGILFIASIIATYAVYFAFIYQFLRGQNVFILTFGTFFAWIGLQLAIIMMAIAGVYFFLNIQIYNRTKIIESLLPDYLALVATNLKGGMHFEKSLWAAIKSEFGILAKEIGVCSKKVATGTDVSDALDEFAMKYDSPILRRSVDLVKGELMSGGRVADVIENLVDNLRKTKQLKEEMVATSLSYMIFMAFIVIVITPALFALSKQLVTILVGIGGRISQTSQVGVGMFQFTPSQIVPSEFHVFAMFAIGTISVFTSIIISIIEKGDMKGGVKYIPVFLFSSVALYMLFAWGLSKVMGGLVTI